MFLAGNPADHMHIVSVYVFLVKLPGSFALDLDGVVHISTDTEDDCEDCERSVNWTNVPR